MSRTPLAGALAPGVRLLRALAGLALGAGLAHAAAGSPPVVRLASGTVDPRTEPWLDRAALASSGAARQLALVALDGPPQPAWVEVLVATGVRVVGPAREAAYLVYGTPEALGRLVDLAGPGSFVRWVGAFRPEHRVARSLRAGPAVREEAAGEEARLHAVQLVEDAAANAVTLAALEAVAAGGSSGVVTRWSFLGFVNVVARLDAAAVDVLAGRPDVVSIQPYAEPEKSDERQAQIVAGNLAGWAPSGPGYLAWLRAQGLDEEAFAASGFAIDLADSGIDDGTTAPHHFALYERGRRPGTSRVVYNRLEGRPNPASSIQGCDGHGTLDAHIAAGYVEATAPPHVDAQGFAYGLGICPFVRIGSSVLFDPTSFTYPSFPNMLSRAHRDGARISSNSWGANVNGAYNADAQAYDALVRDARPAGAAEPLPGNQEMVVVFSAGNGRNKGTIGSPGSAKNVITVGASENVRPFGAPDRCGVPDSAADSAADVAFFSSRGPCLDGRSKPDLVAPGTHVTGGVFQDADPPAAGHAAPCFGATQICGGTRETGGFWPAGQEWTTASSGTSHAAPAVAGAAALVRQRFVNEGLSAPSAAMTKAVLMNAARPLDGIGAGGDLWSNAQGMGLLDVGEALRRVPSEAVVRDQLGGDVMTASGEVRRLLVEPIDAARPVRVTLAWTDPPGPTFADALVNDLDLVVTAAGTSYRGNVFSGNLAAPGGEADRLNNVESVFLAAGVGGPILVEVAAASLAGPAIPGHPGPLNQDFALVVSNARPAGPRPFLRVRSTALTVETCAPANGAIDPGEDVALDVVLENVGTAGTQALVATLAPTGGVEAPGPAQVYGGLAGGGGTGVRSFPFRAAAGGCGGTLTASFALRDGAADLGSFHADLPLGGRRSASFTNAAPISAPAGRIAGPFSPYPAHVTVSGVDDPVIGVSVTLHGVTHDTPGNLTALLVSPSGRSVLLMSGAGGGYTIAAVDLTFDDAASRPIPAGGPLETGVYRPARYTPWQLLPAPAPPCPWGSALSHLEAQDPNGSWSLYVVGLADGDVGAIRSGFTLTFTTLSCCASCVPPATPLATSNSPVATGADLVLSTPALAGASYGWTGPNGFWSPERAPVLRGVRADASGTYSVTVTAGGCTSQRGSTAVTVTPSVPVTVRGDLEVCVNADGGAEVSTDVPDPSFAWTVTNSEGYVNLLGPRDGRSVVFRGVRPGVVAVSCLVTDEQTGCSNWAHWIVRVVVTPVAPAVSVPATVRAGATGLVASVPPAAGSTWAWTLTNGEVTSGQGTNAITFTAGSGGTATLTVAETNAALCRGPTATARLAVYADGAPCVPSASSLCFASGRFRAAVTFRDYTSGLSGSATAVPLTADTGAFWFLGPSNLELFVKLLDGTSVNGKYWVLFGALSDMEYTLTVTDVVTGATRSYVNPARHLASVADVAAFEPAVASRAVAASGGSLAPPPGAPRAAALPPLPLLAAAAPCVPGPASLCLDGARFSVSVRWASYTDGSTGEGKAIPLTSDTGAFWFFAASNLELAVKVLDGTAVNGKHWVLWGALTDVEYEIRVADSLTGAVRTYRNPAHLLSSGADTEAFGPAPAAPAEVTGTSRTP